VAVVGVRRRSRHWELATRGVVAYCAMPALPKFLYPALAALRVDLWVYYQNRPPPDRFAQTVDTMQTYRLDCKTDFEAHWKQTGLIRSIKRSRRLAERFTFEVDAPGSAAWAIRDWAAKWKHSPASVSAPDFLVAAEYLQARKLLHSFWLLDESTPVAGRIMYVDGDDLVLACTSYLEEYRQLGVGVRLFEQSSQWAARAGYATINLGGGHDYKAQWAPQGETIWTFNVAPNYVYLAKRVAWACRAGLAAARTKFFARPQEPTLGETI
jgi:GNAT superfamily N-acetyltransferase